MGFGIFDNDTAYDTRGILEEYLDDGMSLREAFNKMKEECIEKDTNKVLALAILQKRYLGKIDDDFY